MGVNRKQDCLKNPSKPISGSRSLVNRLQSSLGANSNGFAEFTKWVKPKGIHSLFKRKPWEWAFFKTVRVHTDCNVEFEGHRYNAPKPVLG